MKKFLISGMIVASLLTIPFAQAETTICDAKIALADARFNLMMMVFSMDKAEQDTLKIDIDKASIALERSVNTMLKDERKFDDTLLTSFQETWAQFKNTRETKIVPAIRVGNNDKATEIATGIQAERMNTMNGIIQALNGDNCDLE